MGLLGVILKGVGSLVFGPAFTVLAGFVEYAAGMRSGASLALSLGLSTFVDFDLDCGEYGFEIDDSPSEDLCESSVHIANQLLGNGAERLSKELSFEKTSNSGLFVPKAAVVDVRPSTPYVQEVWRKKEDSGLYFPQSPPELKPVIQIPVSSSACSRFLGKRLGRTVGRVLGRSLCHSKHTL